MLRALFASVEAAAVDAADGIGIVPVGADFVEAFPCTCDAPPGPCFPCTCGAPGPHSP